MRREKYIPNGGPDGGDGGRGGHVILRGNRNYWTLLHLKYDRHILAGHGESGSKNRSFGKDGADKVIEVPCGTVVYNAETGEYICDVTEHEQEVILLKGGRGGLGNWHFKTATRQAPRFAQPGEPMQELTVIMELKLLADVGLVGFPNAGKSTLLASVSAAKPKIANYPFTTLEPNLGIVSYRDSKSFVMADIPGIIEGASAGKGLGLRFLRHIERTAVLAHVVDAATLEPGRDPASDIEALEAELAAYESALDGDTSLGDLKDRPRIIILNKADVPEARELAEFVEEDLKEKFGWPIFIISTVAHQGLEPLKYKLMEMVQAHRAEQQRLNKDKVKVKTIIRPKAVDGKRDFVVEADPQVEDGFIIRGEKPERWIRQTDFENDEAIGFLGDRLAKLGVEEALFKAGAVEGCTVTIGEISFEWEPMTAAGVDTTMTGRGTDVRLEKTGRVSAAERKRASQVRRGLIDEFDFGDGQVADRERWQG